MSDPSPVYWLSFHTPYACRHSGVCCSSNWDIAVEGSRVAAIDRALGDRRIIAPVNWLRSAEGAPDDVAGVLARDSSGACVFHRAPGCAIHAAIGHDGMPSACQHFPRIALVDRRGVFVTLSHYCPTAAALLFEETGVAAIVKGAPVLPHGGMPEGLDARDALPPSESPRRLMDWDGYSRWEEEMVRSLTMAADVREFLDLRAPAAPSLSERELFALARSAVPAPLTWPSYCDGPKVESPVIGRYLAAHTFAGWMAYQGNGLAATLLYLRVALAVLSVETRRHGGLYEGVRRADLLLRHFVDRETLAAQLSAATAQELLRPT